MMDKDKTPTEVKEPQAAVDKQNEQLKDRIEKMTELLIKLSK